VNTLAHDFLRYAPGAGGVYLIINPAPPASCADAKPVLKRLYRLFHRTHHRSFNPTQFTSYAFDSGEALIQTGFLPLFVALVPILPAASKISGVRMMGRNVLGHCGYEVFPARRNAKLLFDWMTTVTRHDMHNAHAGYNLGLYFTWWDRWMGTEHPGGASGLWRCLCMGGWQACQQGHRKGARQFFLIQIKFGH
jgi:hypothetical protein